MTEPKKKTKVGHPCNGDLVWSNTITQSRTPQHGDGNIFVDEILHEQRKQTVDGVWSSLFNVSEGTKEILIGDMGFKRYLINSNAPITLQTFLHNQNQEFGK